MTRTFSRLCVYCGSNFGKKPIYRETAEQLGTLLAERGIELVYGGGKVGLMGTVADAVLAAGGRAIGVIPKKLEDLEVGHRGLTELITVEGMHARKAKMAELSDGFIALPGGFGTFEEVFEAATWTQLNYHLKPVCAINVDGYYDHLKAFLQNAVEQQFIRKLHQDLICFANTPAEALDELASVELVELSKWLERKDG